MPSGLNRSGLLVDAPRLTGPKPPFDTVELAFEAAAKSMPGPSVDVRSYGASIASARWNDAYHQRDGGFGSSGEQGSG